MVNTITHSKHVSHNKVMVMMRTASMRHTAGVLANTDGDVSYEGTPGNFLHSR